LLNNIISIGDHCGKFVRRIHHRNDEVIFLAVINRIAGVPDTLTGEQLELARDFLCVCGETYEKDRGLKAQNELLMAPLREEARKRTKK
jgi:hypothetical protein